MLFSALSVALVIGSAASAEYSYDDTLNTGPSNWANLNIPNNECGGTFNSPINLTTSTCFNSDETYVLDAGDCSIDDMQFQTVDNGVKAFFDSSLCKPNRMTIPNVDGIYEALQFHVHIDTEHTFAGNNYEFELHVVHQKISGTGKSRSIFPSGPNLFAVYGYAIDAVDAAPDNTEFQKILDAWVVAQNAKLFGPSCSSNSRRRALKSLGQEVSKGKNLRKLLDPFDIYGLVEDKTFYHYSGGLTTPPCTETVWWNAAKDPVVISKNQASVMRNLILDYRDENCTLATNANPTTGSTARPPTPLNSRDVQLYCAEEGGSLLGDLYNGILCGLLGC